MRHGILFVSNQSELVDRIDDCLAAVSTTYAVEIVCTAAKARARLIDAAPAILMVDATLPDGAALRLLDAAEGCATVLLAPTGAEELVAAAVEIGCDEYLLVDPTGHFLRLLPLTLQRALARQFPALQETLRVQAALLAHSSDFIATGDAHGNLMYVNDSGAAMIGMADPQAISRYKIGDFHLPEDTQRVLDDYIPVAAHTGKWQGENRLRALDGRLIDVRQVIFPLYDAAGNILSFATIMVDMTAQRAADDALRVSEERYRRLVESSDSAIAVVDGAGTLLFANATVCALTGRTADEIVGVNVRELVPASLAHSVLQAVSAVMRSGAPLVVEDSVVLQGMEVAFRTSLQPLRDALGEVEAVLINGVDLTELKQTQNALRRNEELLQLALSSANIAVGAVDRDTRITWVFNPDAHVDPSVGVGTRIADILSGEETSQFLASLQDTIAARSIHRFDIALSMPEGTRTYSIDMHPVLEDGDVVTGAILVSVDITERVQAEAALHASERRYRQLFELHGLPNLIIDPAAGRILDASPAAAAYYGYALSELRGMALADISLCEQHDIQEAIAASLAHDSASHECVHRLADGDVRHVEIFTGALEVDGRMMIHAVVTDITARKEAADAMERSAQILEQRVVARTAELQRITDRLEAIFHGSADGILLVDQALNIRQANLAFERQAGLSSHGWVDTSLCGYLSQTDCHTLISQVSRKSSDVQGQSLQLKLIRSDRSMLDIEINVAPVGSSEDGDLVCIIRDIGERKAAAQKLAEERNLLRTVINAIPDMLYVKDREHRYMLINDAYMEFLQAEAPDEVLGTTLYERFSPELIARIEHDDAAVLTSGIPLLDISHSLTVDQPELRDGEAYAENLGGLRWGLTNKTPLVNLAGDVSGLIGVTRDVTAMKASEMAARHSERRYRATIDAMSEGLVLHAMDGAIEVCNHAAERILGLTADQMMGRTPLDPRWHALHEDYSPFPGETHPAAVTLTTGAPQRDVIMGVHKPSGELTWVSINSELVVGDNGRPFGVVATFTDITTLKRQEEALRASERRLELALWAGGVGVWEWDIEHDFEVWDERTREMHGVTDGDLMSSVHPDDRRRLEEEMLAAVHDGANWDTEYRARLPDGSIRYIRSYAVLFNDSAGQPQTMVGVVMDMTDEKEAAAVMQEALQRETELGELKSRFVSMASHEFRTPLAAILATTETLSIYRDRMDNIQIDARLNKIRRQVAYMKDIIDDVLVLERIQAGRMEYDPHFGWLDSLCAEVIEEFSSRDKYNERIVYECRTPTFLSMFDDRLMRQIVSNLLSNGLKYSDASTQVYVELVHATDHLHLTVEDAGIGIPETDLAHLFEPFHRGHNVGTISGTGLGLAVVHRAVELHKGRIEIDSAPGRGTRAMVIIPIDPLGRNDSDTDSGH